MSERVAPEVIVEIKLRTVKVPQEIENCSGILVMGKLIKSLLYSTDVSIIANNNADAIIAVYPFTPQLFINEAVLDVASVPVFVGVGGGVTRGIRSASIALQAELHGAYGVVVNAPMDNENIQLLRSRIDIPILATIVSKHDDYHGKIKAGAKILNISGGSETIELVKLIRKDYLEFPIIATGGPNKESVMATIEAGANAITYTPPSQAEIFGEVMEQYRKDKDNKKK